jgi:hypothetical protein
VQAVAGQKELAELRAEAASLRGTLEATEAQVSDDSPPYSLINYIHSSTVFIHQQFIH